MLTPLDLMTDPHLFAARFAGPSFAAWRALVATAWGLAHTLDPPSLALVERCTGRTSDLPTAQVRELWMVIGRRGGKSLIAAMLAVFLACFRQYVLAPGERGVVMVIAADRRQSRVVKRYVSALLHSLPMLHRLIASETRSTIVLSNGIDIEIHTASFRAVRGYTVVGAILDEIAFWPTDDAADPDTEILNALRPAMSTIPDALLVALSSPYARRGELWTTYKEHFGQPTPDVLVWQASTRDMNPAVSERVIARAYERDETAASAEHGAQFRTDVESFLSLEVIDAVTVPGCHELPRLPDAYHVGFLDFAGGGSASSDSATACVAHPEHRNGRVIAVMDAIREVRPPFSPEQVCGEFAAFFTSYGVERVTSDKWAGQFPVEGMAKHGILVEPSAKPKSDLYREVLPLLNSRRVELLDHPRLHAQFTNLERRTARGGRDSIDHPPKHHDDLANAAAGALLLAAEERPPLIMGSDDSDIWSYA
jgi:hypothetical protein